MEGTNSLKTGAAGAPASESVRSGAGRFAQGGELVVRPPVCSTGARVVSWLPRGVALNQRERRLEADSPSPDERVLVLTRASGSESTIV